MTRRLSLRLPCALLAVVLFLSVVPVDAAESTVATARFQPDPSGDTSLPGPEHDQQRKKWKKAWIAAWVAFGVVSFLDIHSSAGKTELNPLLRGQDGHLNVRRAALIKAAGGAAFFGVQAWIAHKHPEQNFYKPFAFATAGIAAPVGITAARNYGLQEPAVAAQAPAYLLRQP